MNVAIISTASGVYEDFEKENLLGTEFQLYGLAKALAKRGLEVFILRRWKSLRFIENIAGVHIVNIQAPHLHDSILKNVATKLVFSKIVAKHIKVLSPDIIQSADAYTAYYAFITKNSLTTPKVFTFHSPFYDWTTIPVRSSISKRILWHIKRPFNLKIQKRAIEYSDAITVPSKYYTNLLENMKSGKPIFHIPNGVEINKLYKIKSEDHGFILYGGRLSGEKGVDILIKGFALVIKDAPYSSLRLVIAGSGPKEKYLRSLVKALGIESKVKFLPFLPHNNFLNILARCSIFVLPSFYETFGIVVLEAMALGKPVIASNIPGPNELIQHGINGFLFPAGDFVELAKNIKILMNNEGLRKKIGTNAKNGTVKYDFDSIAKGYIEVYKSLIG